MDSDNHFLSALRALRRATYSILKDTSNLENTLQTICREIISISYFKQSYIAIEEETGECYRVMAYSGINEQLSQKFKSLTGFQILGTEIRKEWTKNIAIRSVKKQRKIVSHQLEEILFPLVKKTVASAIQKVFGVVSYVAVPLIWQKRAIGGMLIVSGLERIPEEALEMLDIFAHSAAFACIQSRLNTKLLKTTDHLKEEKRKTKEIEISREKYRFRFQALFEQIPDSVYLLSLDPIPRIMEANPAACHMHGYSKTEIVGLPITRLDRGTDPGYVEKTVNQLKERGFIQFETIHTRKDGTTFPVAVNARLIQLNGCAYILAIDRDISEYYATREEIRKKTEDLALINSLNSMVNEGESLKSLLNYFTGKLRDMFSCTGCSVYLLSSDRQYLDMVEMKMNPEIKKAIEAVIEMPVPAIRLPLSRLKIYSKVIQTNQSVIITTESEKEKLIKEFLNSNILTPERREFINKLIPQIIGVLQIQSIVLLPLINQRHTIGILEVSGSHPIGEVEMKRLTGIAYQVTTIIRRKQTEEELFQLSHAIEQSQNIVVITDVKGHIEYVNPRFSEVTGYSAKEVLGKNPRILKSGETPREVYKDLWETILSGKVWRGEFHNRKKDGNLYWESTIISPVKNDDGEITHFIAVKEDITARKAAEWERDRAHRLLQTTIDGVGEPLMVINLDYRIELLNRKAKEKYLNGKSSSEVQFCYQVSHGRETPCGDTDPCPLIEVKKTLRPISLLHKHVQGDGNIRYVEMLASPLLNEKAELIGIIESERDITDRRIMEQELAQAQKMEAIGRLAGGVAHDFNNVLTVIQGYGEILHQTLAETDQRKKFVQEILNASQKASQLTGQLLAFSRKQVVQPQVVNLSHLVANIEKMLHRLIGEDIQLDINLESRLKSVKIDPSQVDQIILNMAVNSRDAMPRGGRLTIQTKNFLLETTLNHYSTHIPPGEYVLLSIRDTGVGIDRANIPHIFEPFFTTKEKGKGTGLGLSTVYGIVQQNNGYIVVESEPGIGTTFTIYFPALTEKVTTGLPQAASYTDDRICNETILVVEDEPAVRELTKNVLSSKGYKVYIAENGQKALETFQQLGGAIDLLLTDVIMPEMDGAALVKKIKEKSPLLKCIYISGYTDDAISQRGIDEKEVFFIQKPFTPGILVQRVREVLDGF